MLQNKNALQKTVIMALPFRLHPSSIKQKALEMHLLSNRVTTQTILAALFLSFSHRACSTRLAQLSMRLIILIYITANKRRALAFDSFQTSVAHGMKNPSVLLGSKARKQSDQSTSLICVVFE